MFTWDDTFAIVQQLKRLYPEVNPEEVSLNQISQWTISLPDFCDDPGLANEEILNSILIEWFEEFYES